MAPNAVDFAPDYWVPPGAHLIEVLEAKGMSQSELATRMGRPLKTINEIVKGKASITAETAIQLERALGVSAKLWNALESAYQLELAQKRDCERLLPWVEWAKRVPTKELTKRGVFEPAQDEIDLVRQCLDFFGIDSPETLLASSTVAAFRKSPAFDPDDLAMCTWLRLGELEAARLTCAPFDKLEFKNALVRLRLLSREPNLRVIRAKIEELCAAVGVAVCFISELQRTHVCGAARWLTSEKALIQLSCRYESDDQFWFTFFHECAHVLLHGKKEGFLERAGSLDDEEEDEANEFAANHLIPRQAFVSLMREKPISKDRITAFAEEHQISPGIVLGQLQKRKRLPFQTNLNQLKRFKFDLTSA